MERSRNTSSCARYIFVHQNPYESQLSYCAITVGKHSCQYALPVGEVLVTLDEFPVLIQELHELK